MKNIVLIGITGVGKSTIGKILAYRLCKEFIDLDKSIEEHCGVDIPTIFEIEGEEGFRKRETNELRHQINNCPDFVLSLGGGCIMCSENRALLANTNAIIIQLYANIDILVTRLSKSITRRPLFNNVDITSKITELYKIRKEQYDSITDFKVNTSAMKPSQIIETIISYVKTI
ncbi:MAG: shikimate kinase [Burkholderiales bacterium]|nr:shikimate kinase [Burkholderiales bacterium]